MDYAHRKEIDGQGSKRKRAWTRNMSEKNGRYDARFVDRFGKRQSISGKDLKDVKRRYNEALYENEKQINIKQSIILDEWYSEWMNVYKFDVIRENTKRYYNQIYKKHISPTLGKLNLTDIDQLTIKKLIKKLKQDGYGYETQNKVKVVLIDIFNKALTNEYIRKNPAKGISVKRDEKKEVKVLSEEEQILFFDCAKGTFYNNLFVVAVSTGMRIGELAALRWSDIDWETNVIKVTRTLVYQKYEGDEQKSFHFENPKTATSKRNIPINHQCEMALKRQYMQKNVIAQKAPKSKSVDKQYADLLFTTKFDTPINSQIICEAIKKVVDEVNLTRDYVDEIEVFSPHCFRHTFATRCFESGIQPKTVQAYLGHASLQMTMDLYTSVMPKHMSNEMDKVSEVLDRLSTNGDTITEDSYNKAVQNNKIISFYGDSVVV